MESLESLLAEQLAAAKEKATAELTQAEAAFTPAQISDRRPFAVRSRAHAAHDIVKRMQRAKSSGS